MEYSIAVTIFAGASRQLDAVEITASSLASVGVKGWAYG